MKQQHKILDKIKRKAFRAYIQLTIRAKRLFDSIESIHIKQNLLNALPFWAGAFITGIVSVIYAKLFGWSETLLFYIYHHYPAWLFCITPLCFLLAYWMVDKYAKYAKGSGIPQVTAAIQLSTPRNYEKADRLLNLRILFIKFFSSLTMALGGGAIGREGPTIQIAATVFRKINNLLPAWYPKISKQNMLVTGAAAGLAAAFNTPLGGIVFAIEELTSRHFNFFKSALLTGVIIAGLTALNLLGPYLYLGYPEFTSVHKWIVFPVIAIAVIAGYMGSVMGKIILRILKWKSNFIGLKKYAFPIIGGLVIITLAYFIDYRILGSGKEIMVHTLFTNEKHVPLITPLLRFIGTIISFSNGAAGGIFAPALSLGASVGSTIGGLLDFDSSNSNMLILCGMGAALTGITRSPFTSSILIIEMTNNHNIIFYLMLTCLLANMVAAMISRHSFYDNLKNIYIVEIEREARQDIALKSTKTLNSKNSKN